MKNLLSLFFILTTISLAAQTNRITVMTYNVLDFPNGNTNVNGGDAARIQHFTDIVEGANADVILVQEMNTDAGSTQLLNGLNTNGTLGKTYGRASVFTAYGPNGFEIGNMLYFNDDLFDFVSQQEIARTNLGFPTGGATQTSPRAASEYVLKMVNASCANQETEIRFYSHHLKAGSGDANGSEISDADRRDLGAKDLMDYINTLPTSTNIVVGGDMNLYDETEVAYGTMTAVPNTNALLDVVGAWTRNSAADVAKFTQSTRTTSNDYGNFGASGGFDDRFDFLFFNASVNSNTSFVQYVANSYQVFGAAGVPLNGGAANGTAALKTEILQMSDHFPVIMDLDISFDPADACTDCSPSVGGFPVN